MYHTRAQLKRALWQAENGTSGEGHDFHPEAPRIDSLIESMREFEHGEIDIVGLRAAFAGQAPKGFNLDAFIQDMIDAGEYSDDAFEPWPEEEPEDLGPNVVPIR